MIGIGGGNGSGAGLGFGAGVRGWRTGVSTGRAAGAILRVANGAAAATERAASAAVTGESLRCEVLSGPRVRGSGTSGAADSATAENSVRASSGSIFEWLPVFIRAPPFIPTPRVPGRGLRIGGRHKYIDLSNFCSGFHPDPSDNRASRHRPPWRAALIRRVFPLLSHRRFAPTLWAAAALCAWFPAAAAAQTWTREGPGTFLWSDPANWTSSAPIPSIPAQLTFNAKTTTPFVAQNDFPVPFLLNLLSIGGAAQGRITGNALHLVSSTVPPQVTHTGGTAFRIDAPIELGDPTTFTAWIPASVLTLTGPISGNGSLAVTAHLNLSLGRIGLTAAPLTFSGGTLVQNSALDLFGDSAPIGTGVVTLADGGLTAHPITPGLTTTLTNELRIEGTSILRSEDSTKLQLANHVTLAGVLQGPALSFVAGKQLRIDQSTRGPRSIIPIQTTAGLFTQVSANIVDTGVGAAGAINSLTLRAGNTDLLLAGTANTYAGGTIIEPNEYGNAAFVEIAPTSSLGQGGATVQKDATLRLTSLSNLASGKKVRVERGAFVELAGDLEISTQSVELIDSSSEGVLLVNSISSDGLDLTGHDKLILGALTASVIGKPYTPAASTYRLAAPNGATLYVRRSVGTPAVLVNANALIVGQEGMNGSVLLQTPNTYTGGTTLMGGSLYVSTGSLGAGDVEVAAGALYQRAANNALGPAAHLTVSGGAAYLGSANVYAGGTTLTGGRLSVEHPQALGTGPLNLTGGVLTTAFAIANPVRITGADVQLEGGDPSSGTGDPGGGALAGPIALSGNSILRPRNLFTLSGDIARTPGDTGTLSIVSSGTLVVGGANNTYGGGTILSGDGDILIAPGSRLGSGDVALTAGQLVNLSSAGPVTGPARLVVHGGVAGMRAAANYSGGTILTGGVVEVDADNALGTGLVQVGGGTLRLLGAPRTLSNTVIVGAGGSLDLAGHNLNAISLFLTSGAKTRLELAGTSPDAYDRLTTAGPVVFGGQLELAHENSLAASPGQALDVALFGSSSGHFETITGASLDGGLALAPQYLPDRLRLLATFAGDANADLRVDNADFLALRDHFGKIGATWTDGDFTGDGLVGFADYQALALNFGHSATSPQASFTPPTLDAVIVPEPAGLALMITASAAFLIARRRH
jgi:autotransporter-associated beta strand protein